MLFYPVDALIFFFVIFKLFVKEFIFGCFFKKIFNSGALGQRGFFAMAIQAPAHAQRFFLPHNFHFMNFSMTIKARNSSFYMDIVFKMNKVWEFMNANPLN